MSDSIDDAETSAPSGPSDPFRAPETRVDFDPLLDIEPDWEPPAAAVDPTDAVGPAVNAPTPEQPTERRSLSPYATGAPASSGQGEIAEPIRSEYPPNRFDGPVRPIEPIAGGSRDFTMPLQERVPTDYSLPRQNPVSNDNRTIGAVAPADRTRYYPAPQPVIEPERSSRWSLALLAFGSGLLGALIVGGGLFAAGAFDDPAPPPTTAATVAATAPAQTIVVREVVTDGEAPGIAAAVGRKVVPSIVTVEIGTGNATTDFQAFGSGSGVVFSADGLILTNHHVIDGATTSRVIFQDGRIYEAEIMGSDALTDLAVLKVEAKGLTPIEFGSTNGLQIGDRAIAVGNPLGLEGGASLTVGVVSAFDREVDTGDEIPLFGMLQTDAPITNGSSGGALVNAAGKLIGITTAIGVSQSGAEGIGFAIPVEVVNRIVTQIIETGSVSHPFLGVTLATSFIIEDDGAAVPSGAVVVGFAEGPSAAVDAGLQIDDVVLSWNGNRVRTIKDLINGIRGAEVGETITLEVDRGGDIANVDVTLGQRPEGV